MNIERISSPRSLRLDILSLQKIQAKTKAVEKEKKVKFEPNWFCTYVIMEKYDLGAYKLKARS